MFCGERDIAACYPLISNAGTSGSDTPARIQLWVSSWIFCPPQEQSTKMSLGTVL